MHRIVNWQPFLLARTVVLAAAASGFTQENESRIELESSLGVTFFDIELSLAASPTLGLGAGYHLNRFILLNFAFFYTPTHPSEVICRFTKLDPVLDYEISAEFFSKVSVYLRQNIAVDGFIVKPDFEASAGRNEVDWLTLPRESFADGEIEVLIAKTAELGTQ